MILLQPGYVDCPSDDPCTPLRSLELLRLDRSGEATTMCQCKSASIRLVVPQDAVSQDMYRSLHQLAYAKLPSIDEELCPKAYDDLDQAISAKSSREDLAR